MYEDLETLRRDKEIISMPPNPAGVAYDYGPAGVQLELAVRTLAESHPNGQVDRTSAALRNARLALSVIEVDWAWRMRHRMEAEAQR